MHILGRKNSQLFETVTGKEANLVYKDDSVNFYHDNKRKHGAILPVRLVQLSRNGPVEWGVWNPKNYYPEVGEELYMVDSNGKGITFRITLVERIKKPDVSLYCCEMTQVVPPEM